MGIFKSDGTPGNIDNAFLSNNLTLIDIYHSSTSGQTQGSCIDDNGNIYTIHYSAGKISVYNIYTKTETQYTFTANAYGHANDAAFCPSTGKVYVVSMLTTGEVYALDPLNDMSLDHTYIVKGSDGNPTQIWCLAFDRKNNKFIAFDTNDDMLIYDTNFNLVSSKNVPSLDTLWPATRQGMETDGDYIYFVSWQTSKISVVDMDTNAVIVYPLSITTEPETLVYDWNTGMMFVQDCGSGYNIRLLNFKKWVSEKYISAYSQII